MTQPTKETASLRVLHPEEGFNEVRMWRALRTLLRSREDLVPQDPSVLAELLADAGADAAEWAGALATWTARGRLRCLVVGRQRHLALGLTMMVPNYAEAVSSPDAKSADAAPRDSGASSEEDEDAAFEVEVAIDVERERLLLYRVVAAFGIIGLALLLREFLLLWADL